MNRKKLQKIKKPNLALYFAVCFLITGFILALISEIFDYELASNDDVSSTLVELAEYYVKTGEDEAIYDNMSQYVRSYAYTGIPVRIYADDELLFDTNNVYGILNRDIYGNPKIEGLPADFLMTKWSPDLNSNYEEATSYLFRVNLWYEYLIVPNEIYVNSETGEFYPGSVKVGRYPRYTSDDYKVIKELDLTPEDSSLLEGFIRVDTSSDPYFVFFVTGSDMDNGCYTRGFYVGEEYHGVKVYSKNYMASYQDELYTKIRLWGSFVFDVVFSLIVAIVLYTRQKAVYDTFEFRRKTTEAMAHDLKTPLAITSLYVDNLKQSLKVNNGRSEYHADQIEESVAYMNKLVGDILEFSNSENSVVKLNKQTVDIKENIKKYVSTIEPEIKKKKLTVNISGEGNRNTDIEVWNQAIKNLIDNAVKYTLEEGKINIDISSSKVVITNDILNDIESPGRLLEAFVKEDSGRGENSGSGLGLSIAENNLLRLGYKLKVSSKDKKFIVTIE